MLTAARWAPGGRGNFELQSGVLILIPESRARVVIGDKSSGARVTGVSWSAVLINNLKLAAWPHRSQVSANTAGSTQHYE